MYQDRMLGRKCPDGVGGRDCTCCGQAPGASRKVKRREVKRRERQRAAFEVLRELLDEDEDK